MDISKVDLGREVQEGWKEGRKKESERERKVAHVGDNTCDLI